MYVRYTSHDNATLSHMEDALHRFHTFKDGFFLGQVCKKAKAKAIALRTELVQKRKVDKQTNAEPWMLSKKQRELNPWREYISHKIDISRTLDADFNCVKIHLMSGWAKQVR